MRVTTWLATLVLLIFSAPLFASDTIVIGRPAKEVKREYERLIPIATYLGQKLTAHGISKGEARLDGKNSFQATLDLLEDNQIDLLFETPYSALAFIRKGGAVPILSITRDGAAHYNTYIFARKDSGLKSIADLEGKIVAFEDPGSTSAFYLPRKAMQKAGLELAPLADVEAAAPLNKVGYVFAGSELNVSSWVYFGKVDAGTLSNLDWGDPSENPDNFRKEFTIIHQTESVPRMLVLARPDLDASLVKDIQTILLSMADTEEGRNALEKYRISGFSMIDDPQAFTQSLESALGYEDK